MLTRPHNLHLSSSWLRQPTIARGAASLSLCNSGQRWPVTVVKSRSRVAPYKVFKEDKRSAQPPAPRASLLPEQAAAARFCALLLDPGWLPGLGQAGQVPHPLTRAPFVPLAARLSHSAGTARAGVLLGPRLASPPSSCLPASTIYAVETASVEAASVEKLRALLADEEEKFKLRLQKRSMSL